MTPTETAISNIMKIAREHFLEAQQYVASADGVGAAMASGVIVGLAHGLNELGAGKEMEEIDCMCNALRNQPIGT